MIDQVCNSDNPTARDKMLSFADGVRTAAGGAGAGIFILAGISGVGVFGYETALGGGMIAAAKTGAAVWAGHYICTDTDSVRHKLRWAGPYNKDETAKRVGQALSAPIICLAAAWAGASVYDDRVADPSAHKPLIQEFAQVQFQTVRNVCADPMIQKEIDRLRACAPS
jgi:hypothetical protein